MDTKHSLRGALAALALAATALLPAPALAHDDCRDCGTVQAIDTVERKGEASGAGLLIGAVIGGVVGHQIGSGRGQDAATAAGAVGGAVAGHQMEKRRNADGAVYRVAVRMDDGSIRNVHVADATGLSIGARVHVRGNDLEVH